MTRSLGRGLSARLSALYLAHEASALRLAYLLTDETELAHDLVQEAFARVAGRFVDMRKPEVFDRYLRITIVNLARDTFRRRRLERRYLREQQDLEERRVKASVASSDGTNDDDIWDALSMLPHRQRAALVLRYYEDLSEAQAAETLGCSVGALKSLVSRGTSTIRKQLGASDE